MSRAKQTRRRHAAKTREQLQRSHPVAHAIAKLQMAEHMTTIGLEVYLADDGSPQRELLAHLGWMVVIGAEVAAATAPGSTQARALHAALRTIVQMSTDDAWQNAQAPVLHEAAEASKALLIAHSALALQLIPDADWLAARIRAGTAALSDLAGAEIYARPTPTPTTTEAAHA
ncbi:hypothetical protein [uncultured Pseudacidovorax sp.]|uniref:hypothetical protein n=1 Tax=uncultured Pseudacidovorax sp. TaxID=679313 RepID=UPI0025F8075C|nr:hypothetical protein [uncultured Pseudacidovorax sp.]